MGTENKADFSDVSASVDSTEQKAAKADFSDVSASVDSTEQLAGTQSYAVAKGDTLSAIAQKHYAKASAWKKIFEANRDVLDDPDRIKPGQVLKLPPLDA
jgi:nucleoid-associated protein YgaU